MPPIYIDGVQVQKRYIGIAQAVAVFLNGFPLLGFDPASLFANGEVGAWYDPSDLTTMFQDSAGTTPVTAVGQPVGLIRDKSGNNNHASQATAAKRPLLQNDGVNNYLAFDGVDDSMATASINFSSTDKMSVFIGIRKLVDTGGVICELSNSIDTNAGSFVHAAGNLVGGYYGSISRGTAAISGTQASTSIAFTAPDTSVLAGLHSIPDDNTTTRRNAVPFAPGTGDKGAGNFGNYPLFIGSRNHVGVFFNGRIYSLIVLGRLATTQEITDTETWVADKTGVTL